MIHNVEFDKNELDLMCQKWKVKQLSFFGSVIREDFNSKSDIDILIEFQPDAIITLSKFERIRMDFERFFNRKVDLVSKRAVINSRNVVRKNAVLSNFRVVYGA
ncbi:MAG: nucleotidyltransferase domain-containing protein [Ignavibacteria bacterium]|nr:nucleotidyltransferase domain-containing protein [Ignavibacteria bacterium]